MKPLVTKLKPVQGFSHLTHTGLVTLLPLAVFIAVRLPDFGVQLAVALVLISKWRMFAVRPRFWAAILRANSIDIIVGLATVVFMEHVASSPWLQLMWAVVYGIWLLAIKPKSTITWVSLQAFIGQLFGLMALYVAWSSAPLYWLVFVTSLICYLAARHFFDSFEEPYSKMLSFLWGYFGGARILVLGHWLLFYAVVAQPTVILTVVGYGLGVLYYFDHHDKLTLPLKRQVLTVMTIVLVVVIIFSDWSDKVV
jgi:hypothetical protein